MSIQEYFKDWSKVLDLNEVNSIRNNLIASKKDICPLPTNIFKTFHLCSLKDLKVVIIGQEPYSDYYNNVPKATGLAFANSKEISEKNFSPSLECLRESVIDFTKPHGIINFDVSLEKWCSQGVLLLNTALSCERNKRGSHALLWRPFIIKLLTKLSYYTGGIVYVLMGQDASSLEEYIDSKHNYIIKTKHPSYYARTHTRMPSEVWKDINELLLKTNGYHIEWYEEY